MDTEYQIVLSTCAGPEEADSIAAALVQEGLAACVNILPAVRSVYRWRGQVESSSESLLLVKSTRAAYGDIERRIRALHSYELPEIIAVPVTDGLAAYLDWVKDPK